CGASPHLLSPSLPHNHPAPPPAVPPSLHDALPIFSMMKGLPSRSESHCPMGRAIVSVAPPGGNPTTIRTGRVGYACALARDDISGSTAAPAPRRRSRRRQSFIAPLPFASSALDVRSLEDCSRNATRHFCKKKGPACGTTRKQGRAPIVAPLHGPSGGAADNPAGAPQRGQGGVPGGVVGRR